MRLYEIHIAFSLWGNCIKKMHKNGVSCLVIKKSRKILKILLESIRFTKYLLYCGLLKLLEGMMKHEKMD